MADIIRLNTCSGPGLEDEGAVFTKEPYQEQTELVKAKSPVF
jgi:hypothetical protein